MPDAIEPQAHPPRVRGLAMAWSICAGLLLFLAPAMPVLWDRVASGTLSRPLAGEGARWAVSGFGLVLLLVGAFDLGTWLATRWTR